MKSKQVSKNISTKPENGHFHHRLQEGILILCIAVSLFFILALVTYHDTDPAWTTPGTTAHAANAGGKVGAWFADVFLCLFGYLAYLFPFMMIYGAWLGFRGRIVNPDIDYRIVALRGSGFFLTLVAGCGLIALSLPDYHNHVPMGSGGVIGNLVGAGLTQVLNVTGTTLILLAILLTGITLFTGLSWLQTTDRIGRSALAVIDFCKRNLAQLHLRLAERKQRKAELTKPVTPPTPKLKAVLNKPIKTQTPLQETKPAPAIHIAPNKPPAAKPSKEPVHHPASSGPVEGTLPSINLLDPAEKNTNKGYSNAALEAMSREVEIRLQDFGIEVQVVAVHPGPVITRFEMQLAPGVKVSKITSLAKDLARSLSVVSVRVVEVIPGKSVVGLELPNENREIVRLSEVLASQQYDQALSPLSLALGKDIAGHPVIVDLGKMPHLLVAGTTGSGKSVGLNAMLLSLLYKATPDEVRMIMIDPKMLELSIYEGIPHLLAPVVIDMKEAANALRWCVAEMDRRYRLMAALGVRNLAGYNTKVSEAIKKGTPIPDPLWKAQDQLDETPATLNTLPYIVVLVDEFADMMMVVGKKVEELIARIAQKARAAGIHLILATQRPSVDVITGLIKANVPTRIAFQVSSRIDSRTILDQQGAEQLLGHGDMLYLAPGTGVPVRVHGAYVADHEVHKVVEDWKQRGQPEYIEAILHGSGEDSGSGADAANASGEGGGETDPLYDQAVQIVIQTRRASISNIQRRLKIGYNRAARLVEEMENAGLVSAMESNGSREVLVPPPAE